MPPIRALVRARRTLQIQLVQPLSRVCQEIVVKVLVEEESQQALARGGDVVGVKPEVLVVALVDVQMMGEAVVDAAGVVAAVVIEMQSHPVARRS